MTSTSVSAGNAKRFAVDAPHRIVLRLATEHLVVHRRTGGVSSIRQVVGEQPVPTWGDSATQRAPARWYRRVAIGANTTMRATAQIIE